MTSLWAVPCRQSVASDRWIALHFLCSTLSWTEKLTAATRWRPCLLLVELATAHQYQRQERLTWVIPDAGGDVIEGMRRRLAIPSSVELGDDYDAASLRELAKRCEDPRQTRRLLALAAAYDAMSRAEAAKIGGMDRQTLRDWAHRFNAEGPDGLTNRPGAGRPRRLSADARSIRPRIDLSWRHSKKLLAHTRSAQRPSAQDDADQDLLPR